MKKLNSLICLLFICASLFAQEVQIPADLKLESAEDYKQSEQLFMNSTNWLMETPLGDNPDKRKEINAFLMKWMTGSPTVSVELVADLIPAECADCLMMFMSGWTKYSLENNYSKDKVECALAGTELAIAFYEKNKVTMGSNAEMENLAKKKRRGKLKEHVKTKYTK